MKILAHIKKRHKTVASFAKEVQASRVQIYRIDAGKSYPRRDLALRIVAASNGDIKLQDLYGIGSSKIPNTT